MAKAPKAVKVKKSALKNPAEHKKAEKKLKEKALKTKKSARPQDVTEASVEQTMASVEDFFNSQVDDAPEKKEKRKKSKAKTVTKEDLDNEKEDYQKSMEKMAETDPEFYAYLKENDEALLDFDISKLSDDEEVEDDEDAEEGEDQQQEDGEMDVDEEFEQAEEKIVEPTKKSKKMADKEETEVSAADVKAWKKSLEETHSLKIIKKALLVFKAAVRVSEHEDTENSYTLTDPAVFNSLLILVLKTVPDAIQHHVPLKTSSNGSKHIASETKKSKTLSGSLKGHASALAVLLADLQDKDIANLVLKSIHTLLPYFLSFRKPIKELIEAVVNLWGTAKEDDTRMIAFAFLKTAGQEYSKSLLEVILKSTYTGILRNSRRTNIHTMPGLNFQKNSAATLFDIDVAISYQHGFQSIRQLAIHLRNGIVNPNKGDTYKQIYNWQYANSLDFWSRTLAVQCENGKDTPLRELIYPLVQITLGAIRLVPTPQYFPLRFYLVRSLLRLSQTTGVYIPLLPLLTEILSSTVITKSPKASTLKALDFDHNIRATKAYIGTRIYQDGVGDELVDLIGEFFVLHCKSIFFPELAVPAVITLRRFTKKSKNVKLNKQIQRLVERLEANSKVIQDKRSRENIAPTNLPAVNAFLAGDKWEETPLGSYVVVQRQVKAEKARILRESLEADEAEERRGGGADEVGMSDLEDDVMEENDADADTDAESDDSDA